MGRLVNIKTENIPRIEHMVIDLEEMYPEPHDASTSFSAISADSRQRSIHEPAWSPQDVSTRQTSTGLLNGTQSEKQMSPSNGHQQPPQPVPSTSNGHVKIEPNGARYAQPVNGHNQSSAHPREAMETLGAHSKQLINVIRNLDQLNIQSTLPSLPKFAVVGDQSAGKSSVIEAICDITLPRASGTCTRCPFEITTTTSRPGSGPEWLCKIRLRMLYAYDNKYKANRDARKFDRWAPCAEPKIIEFATITDKTHLDRVLRCAQLAILNPSTPESAYRVIEADHDFNRLQVTFSPNIVSLEITGQGLPELSLYDLPGAINRHEDENEQHLVKFIEKLTKFYVADEKTLVLLACAADTDVENSTAFRFVGECKAIPRCMGVLTKADLMSSSKLPNVRKMLKAENFKVGHGWYITKQLSQEELESEVSHAEAGERERRFFATDPRIAQLTEYSSRFAIPAIQGAISEKLTAHIIQDLPEIMDRVKARLAAVKDELHSFPERPTLASYDVMELITNLTRTVSALIRPDGLTNNNFRADYRNIFKGARKALEQMRPHVLMRSPNYEPPAQEISDDETDETPVETPSKSRKRNDGSAHRMTQQTAANSTARATPRQNRRSEAPAEESSNGNVVRVFFSLADIENELEKGSNVELPNQTNPRVVEQFIKRSVAHFKYLVEKLLTMIQKDFEKMLEQCVNEVLVRRRRTLLYEEMMQAALGFFELTWQQEAERARHIALCEMHRPITYHPDLISDARAVIETKLNEDRRKERINEYISVHPTKKLKADDKAVDDAIGPDQYKKEISTMATTLAYYDMAAARMLDTIATLLDYGVHQSMEKLLNRAMMESLRVTDESYCQSLLVEDPEREQARLRLLAEEGKLNLALSELHSLVVSVG